MWPALNILNEAQMIFWLENAPMYQYQLEENQNSWHNIENYIIDYL